MRKELYFEHRERFNGGAYTFREGEWLILVERSKVTG